MAKKLRNIVMMMTHEDANDYIIPKGEWSILKRTRSRTIVDECKTFRPRRYSSVTKLKCKERDWPFIQQGDSGKLAGMSVTLLYKRPISLFTLQFCNWRIPSWSKHLKFINYCPATCPLENRSLPLICYVAMSLYDIILYLPKTVMHRSNQEINGEWQKEELRPETQRQVAIQASRELQMKLQCDLNPSVASNDGGAWCKWN